MERRVAKRKSKRDDLRRRPPCAEPRERILVLCEGTVTEPEYFLALRRAARNPLVQVEIIGQGAEPKRLVEEAVSRKKKAADEAKRMRDAYLGYDCVWCVCDVDDHPRLADAKVQAAHWGVDLAISNPSFELWALLHLQDQTAWIHRDKVRQKLKEHIPDYDKNLPFERLDRTYAKACERAAVLEKRHVRDKTDGNPSTGVFHLCALIRGKGP